MASAGTIANSAESGWPCANLGPCDYKASTLPLSYSTSTSQATTHMYKTDGWHLGLSPNTISEEVI